MDHQNPTRLQLLWAIEDAELDIEQATLERDYYRAKLEEFDARGFCSPITR
jgi:hypothetical protein